MARKLIPDAKVRQRYGVASASTFYRWDKDPESLFPKPIVVNNRKFRDEAELDEYDRKLEEERAARFGGEVAA
jgi:hypothetical protein